MLYIDTDRHMDLVGTRKNTHPGHLHLILGPMFSGKTTRLIQIYKTRTYIGKNVLVINYIADTRYHETMMSTHDQQMIPCIQTDCLTPLCSDPQNAHYEKIQQADTILINEGQFFQDIFENVLHLVESKCKEVFICGLDGDFMRNQFGKLLHLIPFCDSVEKLTSLCSDCRDGTPAIFSFRTSVEVEQLVIGSDNYKPLCRACYLNKQSK